MKLVPMRYDKKWQIAILIRLLFQEDERSNYITIIIMVTFPDYLELFPPMWEVRTSSISFPLGLHGLTEGYNAVQV